MNVQLPPPREVFGPPPAEESFDIQPLLRALARRALLVFTIAVILGGIIFVGLVMQPKRYLAQALIMISPPREQVSPDGSADVGQSVDSAFVESQLEILRSRAVIGVVADKLNLAADPLWNGAAEGGSKKPLSPQTARQNAIDALQGALVVQRRGFTYVLGVGAIAPSPAEAAKLSNAWVDAYLASQFNARVEAAQRANSWLSERLEGLKADVQVKDAAVEAYRAKAGLLTAEGVSLTEQQASDMQVSILKARADLAEKTARLEQVQNFERTGESPDSVAAVINSATIRDLRAKEAEIESRQADLEGRYSDLHPSVQKVRSERESVKRQIQQEITRIAANLQNEMDVAKNWLATLQSGSNSVKQHLVANNQTSIELRQLERDAAATRTIYETLLARFNQISEAESYRSSEARLVAPADIPTQPYEPRPRLAAMLALAFGLLAGLVAAIVAEMLDGAIRTAETLSNRLGCAVLATVPVVRRADTRGLARAERMPDAFVVARPMSTFGEALRALRMSLIYQARRGPAKVVAVTSALPEEGKTTTAIGLARTSAMAGQRVLLVDCDVRRRGASQLVGQESDADLLGVLSGRAAWRDAVSEDPLTSCDVITVKRHAFTPRDLFGAAAMTEFIEEASKSYELVILDCPPVLSVAETRAIARLADETVLITRWGRTTLSVAKAALARLENAGVDVLGVVINGAVPSRLESDELAAYSKKYANQYHGLSASPIDELAEPVPGRPG